MGARPTMWSASTQAYSSFKSCSGSLVLHSPNPQAGGQVSFDGRMGKTELTKGPAVSRLLHIRCYVRTLGIALRPSDNNVLLARLAYCSLASMGSCKSQSRRCQTETDVCVKHDVALWWGSFVFLAPGTEWRYVILLGASACEEDL